MAGHATAAARRAEKEITSGTYRGALHGIPVAVSADSVGLVSTVTGSGSLVAPAGAPPPAATHAYQEVAVARQSAMILLRRDNQQLQEESDRLRRDCHCRIHTHSLQGVYDCRGRVQDRCLDPCSRVVCQPGRAIPAGRWADPAVWATDQGLHKQVLQYPVDCVCVTPRWWIPDHQNGGSLGEGSEARGEAREDAQQRV